MEPPPLIVLELVLGFAVPLGWGVWQLLSLRRDQREADARRQAQEQAQEQAQDPAQDQAPPAAAQPPQAKSGD